MNIFTKKTPQQLEEEALEMEFKKQQSAAAEEGDYAPPPIQESQTDENGNALKQEILDRTGEVDMGEVQLANLIGTETDSAFETAGAADAEARLQAEEAIPEKWTIEDFRFGNTQSLEVVTGTYGGGRLAIESLVESEPGFIEPFARYTTNLGGGTPEQHVYIKNWSEGEGVEEILLAAGIIEGEPVTHTISGFVAVPLYRVTDKFWAFARSKGSVL